MIRCFYRPFHHTLRYYDVYYTDGANYMDCFIFPLMSLSIKILQLQVSQGLLYAFEQYNCLFEGHFTMPLVIMYLQIGVSPPDRASCLSAHVTCASMTERCRTRGLFEYERSISLMVIQP